MRDTINFEPIEGLQPGTMSQPAANQVSQENKSVRRLLLVEEIPQLRAHLRKLLFQALGQGGQVVEVGVGQDASLQVTALHFDIVFFDLEVSDVSGFNLARQIWQKSENTKILFWCSRHRAASIFRLRKMAPANAVYGYALKSQADEEIVFAIQCLLINENSYMAPSVRSNGLERFDLTDVEYDTLCDLAAGLTDKAISLRCGTSTRTIQYRIAGVLAKVLRLDAKKAFEFGLERGFLNARVLVVTEALRQGLLDFDQLNGVDYSFWQWSGVKATGAQRVSNANARSEK